MPVVSVIVPIFNAEKYLPGTLESLQKQTLQDIEILLVNDGSSDNSLSICQEFEKKDDRFKVIDQENQGVSAARNAGIFAAKGKYIGFVDADDELRPEMYEQMVNAIEHSHADLVVCGAEIHNFDGTVEYRYGSNKTTIYDHDEALSKFLRGDSFCIGVWSKLCRSEIAKEVSFISGKKMHEDKYYIFECIMRSHSVCYMDVPLYIYMKREGSATYSDFDDRWFDILFFSQRIAEITSEVCQEHLEEARYNNIYSKMFVLRRIIWSGKKKQYSDAVKQLRQEIRMQNDHNIRKFLKKSNLLEFYLLKYCFPLYVVMVCVYHMVYGDRN